jgi:hypothetical protein
MLSRKGWTRLPSVKNPYGPALFLHNTAVLSHPGRKENLGARDLEARWLTPALAGARLPLPVRGANFSGLPLAPVQSSPVLVVGSRPVLIADPCPPGNSCTRPSLFPKPPTRQGNPPFLPLPLPWGKGARLTLSPQERRPG